MGIRRPLERGDGWAVIVLVSGRGNPSLKLPLKGFRPQRPKPLSICPDCAYGQILGVTSDQYGLHSDPWSGRTLGAVERTAHGVAEGHRLEGRGPHPSYGR